MVIESIKNYIQNNKKKCLVVVIILMVATVTCGIGFRHREKQIKEITYMEFQTLVNQGEIVSINYSKNKEYMTLLLDNGERYKTLYPDYEDFRVDMLQAGIFMKNSNSMKTEDIFFMITYVIFILLNVVIIIIIRTDGKKVKPKDLLQKSNIRFENVIGLDEIMDDVSFYVSLIKNPKLGEEIGAKVPKGILLTGQPGTGKTLIAKAIAGEAGVPFISIAGSEFQELYKGVGAKRVREVFKIARKNAPCIVFIDEIDAIGSDRNDEGYDSEDTQTINQLLKEMDGFSGLDNVFILAATNFPDKLDVALKRSGRFDRQITVNAPRTWKIRKQLFEYYLKDYIVEDDLNLDTISKMTSGFTGADIATICNEASLVALTHNKSKIDDSSMEEALDKKIFKGNRARIERQESDKRIIAYHEAGHAVMKYLCKEPISRVSIIGTTSGVGGAVFGEDNDSAFMTQEEIKNQVATCYAGRISEIIKFGNATTGAQNDISKATELLISYVGRYGFDKEIGMIDVEKMNQHDLMSSDIISERIHILEKEIYENTLQYLTQQYTLVEKLASILMEKETMTGKEVMQALEFMS